MGQCVNEVFDPWEKRQTAERGPCITLSDHTERPRYHYQHGVVCPHRLALILISSFMDPLGFLLTFHDLASWRPGEILLGSLLDHPMLIVFSNILATRHRLAAGEWIMPHLRDVDRPGHQAEHPSGLHLSPLTTSSDPPPPPSNPQPQPTPCSPLVPPWQSNNVAHRSHRPLVNLTEEFIEWGVQPFGQLGSREEIPWLGVVVAGVVALDNPSSMVIATVNRLAVHVSKEWYGFVYHRHLPPFPVQTGTTFS